MVMATLLEISGWKITLPMTLLRPRVVAFPVGTNGEIELLAGLGRAQDYAFWQYKVS